jgi:uncharacterized NAD(P)/FAD-binding protein YdhS
VSYTPRIVIVGGGLTGAAAAIQLLRTIDYSFDLVMIEPEEQLGRGLAYGKAEAFHLLNVRAGKLGIFPDQPNDFAAWARGRNFGIRPRFDPPEPSRAFLPRRLFGAYVEARLQEEIANRPDVSFVHLRSAATEVRRSPVGYEIAVENHPSVISHFVILATGYGRSSASSHLWRSPFTDFNPNLIHDARTVLLVGTGLTFVDEFLRLRSRGFRGEALAVSRHGLLPEVHRANEAPRNIGSLADDPNLATLLKSFRGAMEESDLPASAAVDLVLGLREKLQSIWLSLGVRQQRRFLRHLRPYWNVARHRLAPEIHVQLRHSMQNGMVKVAAARIINSDGNEVRIHARGEKPAERRFDLVFDCTGFRPEIRSPVILSLVKQGLARVDPHRLGLSVTPSGSLLTRHGAQSPGLFALGPLGHGSLYEITAVPEIVAQSAAMATCLRTEMRSIMSIQRTRRESRGTRPGAS